MRPMSRDRYAYYEAAVQSVDWEIDFMTRLYRRRRGRPPRSFREDFCSTAALATEWAARHRDNRAIGVDLDPEPLAWARKHRLPHAGEAATRVHLVRGDVRTPRKPLVDVACALNYSWWVFHQRKDLLTYLKAARAGLAPGGILVMDSFGGDGSERTLVERTRKRSARTPDGGKLPRFTYVWEHAEFDAITRHLLAHIHFLPDDGPAMKRAFTYDWRMWTLIELRELAGEAGFSSFEVYAEGWDDRRGCATGVMHKRTQLDNADSWIAAIVLGR
jgi:SAM-dependent methyltransferase